jgi:hypothetical protein
MKKNTLRLITPLLIMLASFLLSGCGFLVVPISQEYHIGNPASLDDLISKIEARIGEENVTALEGGKLIDIRTGSEPNTWTIHQALAALCERTTIKTGPHGAKTNKMAAYKRGHSGNFQIPVLDHLREAVPLASKQYESDNRLFELAPHSSYCIQYPLPEKIIDIPFGWVNVAKYKKGENETRNHNRHLIIAHREFFDPLLAEQRAFAEEKAAAEVARNREIKAQAEEIMKREEEVRKRKEASRKSQREYLKDHLAIPENLGRKICKDGTLRYKNYLGFNALVNPAIEQRSDPGQVVAQLDDLSPDRYRIKFRVLNWATITGKLSGRPPDYPFMGDFKVEPGAVYWDDVVDWRLCD